MLADDKVELLSLVEAQGAGIACAPIDAWPYGSRNGKHLWADIDADDLAALTEPLFGNARNYSRSACNVEDTITGMQFQLVESYLCPGAKRGPTRNRSYNSGKEAWFIA